MQSCQRKAVPTLPTPPQTLAIEEIDFGYLHSKARMIFRDEKKERDVKANIRIRKDSVIWMTFSVDGHAMHMYVCQTCTYIHITHIRFILGTYICMCTYIYAYTRSLFFNRRLSVACR